jgi:hypothetical protein
MICRVVRLVYFGSTLTVVCRGRLVLQLQNPLVGRLRINRLLARPRLVLQPFKAMVGIAMPPKADNPRLDPNFLGGVERLSSISGGRRGLIASVKAGATCCVPAPRCSNDGGIRAARWLGADPGRKYYAPTQHALLEQVMPRVAPSRAADAVSN